MKIFKYTIHPDELVAMPKGAKILSTCFQGAYLRIWAAIDPIAALCKRDICVVGTGQSLPEGKATFIATVHLKDQGLVFHIFDCGEVE